MISPSSLVSVIIPCYNDHKYILKAIDSINQQTYKNVEIFVIDDGSDETTKQILRSIKQANLFVLHQPNGGPSNARNNGVKEAKGEFILTLDADDYFEPSFLEKALLILENSPRIGLVTCNGYIFNENGIIGKIISKKGSASDFLFSNTAFASSLFRKRSWSDVGGYDEDMKQGYEDWDFNVSILNSNWEIEVIDDYLINYMDKPNSRNKNAYKSKYAITRYVLQKHKRLSIQNFDKVLELFFEDLIFLSNRNDIIKKSLDYRLGQKILKPFRYLKNLF